MQKFLPALQKLLLAGALLATGRMQANPAAATSLPLRAAAWEKDGAVWLTAVDPVGIAAEHGITDPGALALRMRAAVDDALREAVAAP